MYIYVFCPESKYKVSADLFLGAITICVPDTPFPPQEHCEESQMVAPSSTKREIFHHSRGVPRLLIWAFVEELLYSCPPFLLREEEKTQVPDVKCCGI